jgi:hypothetical protein
MKRAATVDPRGESKPAGRATGSPLPAPPRLFVDFAGVMMVATRPLLRSDVMANFKLAAACCFLVGILGSDASFGSSSFKALTILLPFAL